MRGAEQRQIQYIPLKKLELWNEANVRKNDPLANIEDLARNIAKIGVQVPLLVKYDESEDKYLVFSGQRRLAACKAISLEYVPCIVFKNITVTDARIISLSENLYRQPMNQDDIAHAADALLSQFKTVSEVAAQLGVTVSRVKAYRGYNAVPEEVKQVVREGKMTPKQAINVASRFTDPAKALEFANEYRNITSRSKKKILTQAVKISPPTDDVKAVLETAKKLGEMVPYEIYLPPTDSNVVEKLALNHKAKGNEILEIILEKWIDDYRTGGEDFALSWLADFNKSGGGSDGGTE